METLHYNVTTRITRRGCRAQARAKLGRHRKEILLVTAVLGVGAALLWIAGSWLALWMAIAFVLIGGYGFLVVPVTAAQMYGARHVQVEDIRLSFGPEGIRVHSKVEESLIRYGQILDLMEEPTYLMIRLKHHTPLVFERAEVEDGKSEELMKFLKEQTGMEFRSIRL